MSTQKLSTVSTKLQQIADVARRSPDLVFTSLAHHIDVEFLREAFSRTRKNGATGIDEQTAADYAVDLDANLGSLLNRFKSGSYHAPPVRRVHIPKGDGNKTRPIGIPTFEDKVLQRAVTMVLNAVYEQDFLNCSFGFRPKRSAHDALDILRSQLTSVGGGWVIDLDIQGFFDALDPAHLRDFLDQRIRDGVLRRTIGKWMKAGVMEGGELSFSETGTPQGGVVSPILSNIYLHHVLDSWFDTEVKPRLRGRAYVVRYADDAVIVCAKEHDAKRIMDTLPQRFGRFGLTLHPEKTHLVDFRRPRVVGGTAEREYSTPGTFDFLSFTHHWDRTRRGKWKVARRTTSGRFNRAVKKIALWCRQNRHLPIGEQHKTLSSKLRGHDQYYGISSNFRALKRFRFAVTYAWHKWLSRRSNKGRITWENFQRLLERYPLPRARIVHSSYKPSVANSYR